MNIIILGPPGSGKGTHSKFISNEFNLLHFSLGDILRNEILNNKNNDISNIMNSGKLVNDNIVVELLKKFINLNKNKNILFDGFPRTYNQANIIYNLNIKIDIIIELFIEKDILINRILGRRIHKKSGRIYHMIYNPPLNNELDDITGDKLEIRDDDKKEIIENRINEYNYNIIKINNFYKEDILNNNIKYIKINSNLEINDVKCNILSKINEYLRK
ncbi:adenylate kinase [endosymbiont of Sipalinus gigas]|uniref:adenylate kinase family protein n=1 Tax=endosymbiont of Sipalinus gigas TaxID=1972134 RepID=UPI000DC6FDB9|nr:nucleoside monophosphate kinase [endosymbiont of Sipalinus gigas]BBA85314.1 adenylate kinase [endosymbiont of Sipalinus gigas]